MTKQNKILKKKKKGYITFSIQKKNILIFLFNKFLKKSNKLTKYKRKKIIKNMKAQLKDKQDRIRNHIRLNHIELRLEFSNLNDPNKK